jgi:signal transduction histidine kinase
MKDSKMLDIGNIDDVLKHFLHSMLKEIMQAVKADCGSLFLFDSEHKELILDSFHNSCDLHLEGLKKSMGEGVCGKVVELNAPVLVSNIEKDLRFKKNGFKHYRTNSFMSIPLFGTDKLLGLINLADKSNNEPFSGQDLSFATSLAKYACVIVEHLLHYSRLKDEKEKLSQQKSLLEKYASVGKLAAGVVHEINNPLDGVIRYTNILFEQVQEDSIIKEYLFEVKRGLGRIANITRSLLEFSHQINSNEFQFKRSVPVHKIIDESLEILKGKINKDICVIKRYMPSTPKILDFGLQHAVLNIIKNAVDAMPAGGILEISTYKNDSVLGISFKDTGQGIPSDIMEQIFEPFFTTKSIDKGTGLGLSMCKEIVNKYEGRIEVKSALREGSTFSILIPIRYLENA